MTHLKKLVKAVVPQPLLHQALAWRDRVQLQQRATAALNLQALRALQADDLKQIWQDAAAQATWPKDHAAIAALYGAEDKYGGVNPGDRRALYHLVASLKPQRVLEVGTHIGASTLYMARALQSFVPQGQITTVDIIDVNDAAVGAYNTVGLPKSPRAFAADIGCADGVRFVAEPCQNFMARHTAAGAEKFDLIFLDGDHRAAAVYNEIPLALQCLSPNGVLVLHDYYPAGAALFPDDYIIKGPYWALQRLCHENPQLTVLPCGNLPWPTKQGVHATSLAVVSRKN